MSEIKKNILLVEDEGIIALMETKLLENAGYQVIHSFSGEQAVEIVRTSDRSVDLILMDIDLGDGMDGTEAAQEILKTYDIPVLFLSSHTEKDVVEKVEKITSYGYVVKNSGDVVLLASIRMAFRLFAAHKDIKTKNMKIEAINEELRVTNENLSDSKDLLSSKEKEYRKLFENLIAGFAVHEMIYDESGNPTDYRFLEINPAFERLTGLKASNLTGKRVTEVLPGTEDYWIQTYGRIARTGEAISYVHFSKNLDCYYEVWAYSPEKDRFAVIITDITERIRLEHMIISSKEHLDTTLNSIGDAVICTDCDSKIVRMNPPAERLTGWTFTEAEGLPLQEVFRIINAETRKIAFDPVEHVLKTGNTVGLANHTVLLGRDGYEYQISDSAAPIRSGEGDVFGVVLVFRDVTEEYAVQKALSKSEANLKEAQHIAQLGRWELDHLREKLEWSDTIYEIFEIDRSHFGAIYESFLAVIHPEDRSAVDSAFTDSLQQRKPYQFEHRLLMKDGRVKWVLETGETDYDDDGKPVSTVGTVQDITEQYNIREKLKKQNLFIRTVLDNLPIGVAVNEFNSGKATYMNPKFAEIYGWPERELEDVSRFFELIYPDPEYREKIRDQVISGIESGDPSRMQWNNIRITTAHGETRYIDAMNIPLIPQNIMVSTVQKVDNHNRPFHQSPDERLT